MTNLKKCSMFFLLNASVFLSCYGGLEKAQDVSFESELDGSKQYYMEMLPTGFDKNKHYDLIIGLHGHGSDRKQFALDKRPECRYFRAFAAKHNMITIIPDYRAKTSWMGPAAEADLVQIIKELKVKYKINKVFLVGASMGGASVLTFAVLHSDMVDGITSMNGHANHVEYNRFQAAIAKSFGGINDHVVPPRSIIRLAENLKKRKRKVMLIKRPQGGHSTSFAVAMAAMEFMFTGIPKIPPKPEVKPDISKAAIIKCEVQPGEGGTFFAKGKPARFPVSMCVSINKHIQFLQLFSLYQEQIPK